MQVADATFSPPDPDGADRRSPPVPPDSHDTGLRAAHPPGGEIPIPVEGKRALRAPALSLTPVSRPRLPEAHHG
ncbi:hypothetical protein GCM10009677_05670 [Sphaerisporangium rubeum]